MRQFDTLRRTVQATTTSGKLKLYVRHDEDGEAVFLSVAPDITIADLKAEAKSRLARLKDAPDDLIVVRIGDRCGRRRHDNHRHRQEASGGLQQGVEPEALRRQGHPRHLRAARLDHRGSDRRRGDRQR